MSGWTAPLLRQQTELLWQQDQVLGAADSIYRRTLTVTAAGEARAADYAAGVNRALTTREQAAQAMRWYKHANHGEVIDIGMFRIGFERGRFVAARQDGNTLLQPLTVPLGQRLQHVDTHFVYVPLLPGVRLPGGERVIDVRQPFISANATTLHLAPGQIVTNVRTVVATPTLLHGYQQPVLEFVPAAEHLLRAVPNPRIR